MILFLRRKKLGLGSLRGMCSYIDSVPVRSIGPSIFQGCETSLLRNEKLTSGRGRDLVSEADLIVRWGTTSPCGSDLNKQVNPSSAIQWVNDKATSRVVFAEQDLSPPSSTTLTTLPSDWSGASKILRPKHHAQGRNLFVINSQEELLNALHQHQRVLSGGWYLSDLVNKVAEYRVYVVNGRVATVAQKTPENPDAIAWNVAQGGRFDVVNWGDWPLSVCDVAIKAFNLAPGLDFGGVDVMVDRDGRAWVVEINSAPSLPLLSDGSISYRQKCMAKTFKWMLEHGRENMEAEQGVGWRGYIHPAIREYS